MKKTKKLTAILVACSMLIGLCVGCFGVAKTKAEAGQTATMWVVGDSTVSSFTDNYYYPRYGYGTQIQGYLDSSIKVQNLALSGRSSKSYIKDSQYTTLKNGMQSGDFLVVGFGHNDEKAEADRYTNPNGDYKAAGSFANSLYENYIKPAQEAGVTVILCTPVVRRTATGTWSDSNLHITTTTGEYEGGDYPQAIRDLGAALNIPVVDMTALTKKLYDTLGADETINLHAWTSSSNTSVDNTHTNIWGGKYNAYMLTRSMKEQNIEGLSEHIAAAAAPTKEDTLVVNPSYVQSTTAASGVSDSKIWKNAGIWKGTVFGDVGGTPGTNNFTLNGTAGGDVNITVKNNKGKIASTVDGIAMYYYKVPASSTFTISANVKINSYDANDQVSFGLMARDDIYTDLYTKDLLGDYVSAGLLKLTQTGNVWNSFARKSGVLTQGGTCVNTYSAGDTVALKIQGTSDGYTCTVGNEAPISGGFDFRLTAIDSEYVYVGMYAARNTSVTFSNISLIVDGVDVINPETPTTEAPTTEAPTTEAPTTAAPTTAAPTTAAPTMVAPTTAAPTTEAPTTVVPTTVAPTTEAPTTEAPTTEAPTTAAPTTEAPTTEAPTTEAPTTEAPTTEAPTTEAPTTVAATTAAGGQVVTTQQTSEDASTDGTVNSGDVATGDRAPIAFLIIIGIMALISVACVMLTTKKKEIK